MQSQMDAEEASDATRAGSYAGPPPPPDSDSHRWQPQPAWIHKQDNATYPPRPPSTRTRSSETRRSRRSGRADHTDDRGGDLFSPDPRPWPERSLLYQYMPFRGMYHDVKRRLPLYASDWYLAFLPKNWERVVGATVRMYFLKSVHSRC